MNHDLLSCERELALAEGENALLRALVLKLFRGTPSLNEDDRRLVSRLMQEAEGKL